MLTTFNSYIGIIIKSQYNVICVSSVGKCTHLKP